MKTFKEARELLSRQNFTVIGVRSPAGGKDRREAAERVQELAMIKYRHQACLMDAPGTAV